MNKKLLDKAIALADRGYRVDVQREDDENGDDVWVAFVPEMPSCFAQGYTAKDAIKALKTVREDYIYFLLKHGVPVPEPKSAPQEPTRSDSWAKQADAEVINSQ